MSGHWVCRTHRWHGGDGLAVEGAEETGKEAFMLTQQESVRPSGGGRLGVPWM